MQKEINIAIQGYKGAFHEIAARSFYLNNGISVIELNTFQEVIDHASTEAKCDIGIMAIENTISGSILQNYQLINSSKLSIVGEVYLRIRQNLLTLPNVAISDLKEVYSHPIAIAQCRNFFMQYPHIKLIETVDTALSAKQIKENNQKEAGAIASTLAAKLYNLNILEASIETNKENYTRFLILNKSATPNLHFEKKVSICFSVSHEIGSLHKVMSILAFHNSNLTKIQSVPLVGKPFEYLFFVDFIVPEAEKINLILDAVKPFTGYLKILGVYQNGSHYES
jgi:prephenate dehydratase